MSMNNTSVYRSPCEVLRKINDMFQGDGETDRMVRELLAESERKSKAMSIELHRFVPDFYKIWDKNEQADSDSRRRKLPNYKYVKNE